MTILGEPMPVELMNTVWADRAGVHDALSDPASAADWLDAVSSRLNDLDKLSPADRDDLGRRLLALRDALLHLAAKATGDTRWATPDAAALDRAVAAVNAAVIARSPQLVWTSDHATAREKRVHSDPADAVLSTFAEEAIVLFSAGEQSQLRICEGPDCGLYFVKNHPRREWCSTACGNRVRAARHYRRHRKPVA